MVFPFDDTKSFFGLFVCLIIFYDSGILHYKNSVCIHFPSCRYKPVCVYFLHWTTAVFHTSTDVDDNTLSSSLYNSARVMKTSILKVHLEVLHFENTCYWMALADLEWSIVCRDNTFRVDVIVWPNLFTYFCFCVQMQKETTGLEWHESEITVTEFY